jgi:serine/threonine protein phosphatase PrpC
LNEFVEKNEEYSDMGSTLVVALVASDMVHLLNIGDSRAYVS